MLNNNIKYISFFPFIIIITNKYCTNGLSTYRFSMMTRFGDMLSEAMINKIKNFNKTQQTILCFDGIKSEYLEADDLQMFFQPKVN